MYIESPDGEKLIDEYLKRNKKIMAKNKSKEPQNGSLTTPMNVNSREFKEFQLFLSNKVDSLEDEQKLRIELLALQIKIEDYLNSNELDSDMMTVGDFLRLYLDKLDIRQNMLAKYIGLKPSNFSKILSGTRKVNFELSFILSQIFKLDPKVWMLIQVKNEYLELKKKKNKYFQNFKLEDLLKV